MAFDPTTETKEDFEARCCKGKDKVVMPCTCEAGGGPTHWAGIRDSPQAIQDHLDDEKYLAELREVELPTGDIICPECEGNDAK